MDYPDFKFFDEDDPLPRFSEQTPKLLPTDERPTSDPTEQERATLMARTTEKLEAHLDRASTKIHRFPPGLRGIGGDNGRYIKPSVVAIGPYHRGSPHLQEMEKIKLAAAYYLSRSSPHFTKEAYHKVLSVVGDARGCYDADDPAVKGLGDAEFASMMFNDGCFLLQYMICRQQEGSPFHMFTQSSGPSIIKDIFLFENQIPWLVLETLIKESLSIDVEVHQFVANLGEEFFPKLNKRSSTEIDDATSYKPPHLLGLLRYTQIRGIRRETPRSSSLSLSRSAAELAQIGIKLTASPEPWFGDVSVKKKCIFGELSVSPLFLNDVTACWLVNMAALEASTAIPFSRDWKDSATDSSFAVSSYLSVLAMLMDRKEDVHELRGKGVLRSIFSNTQTLAFFKGLGQHLELGPSFLATLEDIEAYKRRRPVRTVVHKFVYNNYKVMATVLSIAGVLAGIFRALYSLKKP
ncbi:hypothetical protein EJB05_10055, partial [Eragrostis curvula]